MKDTNQKAVVDVVILLVIMLASAYMFAASGSFADETKLFPRIVSTAVFVCRAAKLALTARAFLPPKDSAAASGDEVPAKKALLNRRQLILLAASVLYVALLNPIGFLPCTIAILLALPYTLGYRRWKVLIPFAFLISIAFYAIFRYGFYIKLPAGVLSGLL